MATLSAIKEPKDIRDISFYDSNFIKKVMPYSQSFHLKKGDEFEVKEMASKSLFYVQKGAVDVSFAMKETKVVVAILGENEFFGEIGFFDGITRVRDISAIQETEIAIFSDTDVFDMQHRDPKLYGKFVTHITESICKKFRRILDENEPLKAYAASLSTGAHHFVESKPLPVNFFRIIEGRLSNKIVEELKAVLFDISLQLQQHVASKPSSELQSSFNKAMDTFFDELELFNEILEKSDLKDEVWGYLFKETYPYFMRSSLTERAYFKPNGYACDFKMIEMMYRNKPSGDGKIGKLVDAWLLNRPPCRAVRGRRLFLTDMLLDQSSRILEKKNKVNIMNLACGPSRELFDFIKRFKKNDKINAICLDIDPEALTYSDQMAKTFPHNAKISFMKDNLIKWAMGNSEHKLEKQDIIYSGGLFDYLDDNLFLLLADRCYDALDQGGLLVVGNFKTNPDKLFMDNLLEWRLIYREKEELAALFSKSKFGGNARISSETEAGIQLFAFAIKE